MDLRELRYGIEIETVKRTREQIAWAIHSVVGGHVRHIGAPSCYDPSSICRPSTGWRHSIRIEEACISGFWWWLNAKMVFSLAGHTMVSIIFSEAVCAVPVGTGTARNLAKLG